MEKDNKLKIIFEPGCFNSFDGTQEELDSFIDEIKRAAESGELTEQATVVNLEQLFDEDPELAIQLAKQLGLLDDMIDDDGNFIDVEDEQFEQFEQATTKRKNRLN